MRLDPTLRAFLPSSLLVAAAACGGGGGGGAVSPVEPGVNEGSYSAASFGYEDPKPAWFHPLGKPVFSAVRRDEVVCVVGGPAMSVLIEDAGSTTSGVPTLPSIGPDLDPIDAVSGDLDGDGKPELAVIGTFGAAGAKGLRVRIFGMKGTVWTALDAFVVGDPADDYAIGRIDLGDVDGDARDEIVVAATTAGDESWVRVFEDPVDGGGLGDVAQTFPFPQTREVRAIAAQLDDDPGEELVLSTAFGATSSDVRAFDDAAAGYAPLSTVPLYAHDEDLSIDLVALNRDDDMPEEIAVLRTGADQKVRVDLYQDALQGFDFIATSIQHTAGAWSPDDPRRIRRAVAGDLTGDGREELVYFVLRSVSGLAHRDVVVYWGTGETIKHDHGGNGVLSLYRGIDLAVVDRDSDGIAEIVLADVFHADLGGMRLEWASLKFDGASASKLALAHSGSIPVVGASGDLAIGGEDFDMDGVRLRWKGVKFQSLPNPIPMVVLCAPPTKTGISQNYDASEVSYTTSTSTEDAYETATSGSVSVSVGFELEDVTGLSGGSFKTSLEVARKKSLGESTVFETSKTFTGAHDDDVVVFQGTLHMIYVYELVAAADPAAVGTEITINAPVETRIYKWTRTFFNDTFGSSSTLPQGIFSHAVGNPASYPSQTDAADLLAAYEGFDGDSVTVGQGHGSNGLGLSMEKSLGTSTEWSVEVEAEGEAKIAGLTFGISYAYSKEWIWTNTVTSGTSYDCAVGDIAEPADYFDWRYDVGLFTYRRVEKDELPVQVVAFWTDVYGEKY